MKSFEHYAEGLGRAAEDAFVHYVPGESCKFDLLKRTFGKNVNKRERTIAALRFIREFLPADLQLKDAFLDPSKLPFKGLDFSKRLGAGWVNDAYLLENQDPSQPSYVLKIGEIPREDETSQEARHRLKLEYERVKQIYSNIPQVLPKEFILVVENPKRYAKKEAIALIQRVAGRDIKDLFREISSKDLLELAKNEPGFSDTLEQFILTTLKHEKENGQVIDLFGLKNVSVVENNEGKHNVLILDPHVTFSTKSGDPGEVNNLQRKLKYLEELLYNLRKQKELVVAA